MNAFPHLKTVHISPFENMTSEFALAQDFQSFLVDTFQSDGRLRISTISPDARIEGSILDYRHDILSYDMGGQVSEYRVQILFSLLMTDMIYSQVLYDNRSLLLSEVYTPNAINPERLASEGAAVREIFQKAFDIVIKSTLESW
jgi:hypothetical protein